jgi:hypothetical protein
LSELAAGALFRGHTDSAVVLVRNIEKGNQRIKVIGEAQLVNQSQDALAIDKLAAIRPFCLQMYRHSPG